MKSADFQYIYIVIWHTDIDECAMETHACLHQCSNNEGSYECACDEGFYLDKDNTTCKGMF